MRLAGVAGTLALFVEIITGDLRLRHESCSLVLEGGSEAGGVRNLLLFLTVKKDEQWHIYYFLKLLSYCRDCLLKSSLGAFMLHIFSKGT